MFPQQTLDLSAYLVTACTKQSILIATAESCTGGLIAGAITSVSGASSVFERGFNTYSNEAKNDLLGVSMDDICSHGAVSSLVARQMAEGALQAAPVNLTVAVTGIAGPEGGTREKPVGTVHIAVALKIDNAEHQPGDELTEVIRRDHQFVFSGDRDAVRLSTVNEALTMMLDIL